MYDELINLLRRCGKQKCKNCEYEHVLGCVTKMNEKAADAIEELQKQRDEWESHAALAESFARGWIPVTERLPECDLGAEVGNIEWISCGRVYAGCFGCGGKYRDVYFRTWTDAGDGVDATGAAYWRTVTLPEPPEEKT